MSRGPPRPTLFPYTTLFRSHEGRVFVGDARRLGHDPGDRQQHAADDQRDIVVQRQRDGELTISRDRKSTRLNSSHLGISYAVFCLKKKKTKKAKSHVSCNTK